MVRRQDASTGKIVEDEPPAAPKAAATANGQPVMQVKIYSPFQTYFDDPAYSISAANNTGPFDILPRHHNFITLLNAGDLLIEAPTGQKRIRISGGVMHVKADRVSVFLDV